MKVLVIAAHADDEIIGAGACLARHAMNGDAICLLYLTGKITSRCNEESYLGHERKQVAEYLGASEVVADFTDQELDAVPQLALNKIIEREIAAFSPTLIYTHSDADANVDHIAVSWAVRVAAPGVPIRMFEVMSPRRPRRAFNPNRYEDIIAFMPDKLTLLSIYSKELRPYPHPRSYKGIKILALYRGLERGIKYAEAFEEVT